MYICVIYIDHVMTRVRIFLVRIIVVKTSSVCEVYILAIITVKRYSG